MFATIGLDNQSIRDSAIFNNEEPTKEEPSKEKPSKEEQTKEKPTKEATTKEEPKTDIKENWAKKKEKRKRKKIDPRRFKKEFQEESETSEEILRRAELKDFDVK